MVWCLCRQIKQSAIKFKHSKKKKKKHASSLKLIVEISLAFRSDLSCKIDLFFVDYIDAIYRPNFCQLGNYFGPCLFTNILFRSVGDERV